MGGYRITRSEEERPEPLALFSKFNRLAMAGLRPVYKTEDVRALCNGSREMYFRVDDRGREEVWETFRRTEFEPYFRVAEVLD
jgi:hypothetical protein